MYLYIWYRGTFPRYRFDQLMKMGWKVLLPMGLGVLILTATVGLWPLIQQTIWQPVATTILLLSVRRISCSAGSW